MPVQEHDDSAVRERIRDLAARSLGRSIDAITPMPAGLGARHFYRVRLAGDAEPRTVVARVEADEDPGLRPPGIPPEPPLEPIRALLESHGLPVPRCHGLAPDLMLLEDVGDTSLEDAAASLPRDSVHALYREACAGLPALQAIPPDPEVPNFERRLDDALFRYKADQVIEWVLPLAGAQRAPTAEQVVRDAFAFVAEVAREAPLRLAHRDFKAANLHIREPGTQAQTRRRLTWIDLQGAFLAPPEYDLVCLLRDSHVELEESFVRACLEEIRPRLPDAPAPGLFAERFALLTLTRNGKDLARYRYAASERGDARYLRLVPRAIHCLRAAGREVASLDPKIHRFAEILDSLPEAPCGH